MDDDDRRAEIAELRRRVFGPVDGPVDPDALARLRELEGRGAAASADPRRGEPDDARAADPQDGVPPRRARRLPRIRRHVTVAWAASVVLAAVASASATAWWLGDERGTVAMLALEPPPVPDNATYLSVDTGSIAPGSLFAAFDGISVARVPRVDAGTGAEAVCLVAGPVKQDGSVEGPEGCATGAVPARTALVVTADQPQELRDAFPLGTTLTFELEDDGETVRVRTVGG
ncbi:hypothetical protein C5C03_02345 [Clavibacter michiganensis]|uniref:hypothetical protein n=1 Tax=Clavibacter michiganensis TaxID=28447 RepID=UPI000CE77825|nr:hypothetical protein [Clavibacter michiganensis]PPF90223.1 hypothetical protein C5C03_02345 [Clavibacter michiganensis]PPF98375.1 hypothetical protein C5C05_03490 [Clavibacter michiganensis]